MLTNWNYNKAIIYNQLLDEVFWDIQNNPGQGKCYQPNQKAKADQTYMYQDLDYFGHHKKTEFTNY